MSVPATGRFRARPLALALLRNAERRLNLADSGHAARILARIVDLIPGDDLTAELHDPVVRLDVDVPLVETLIVRER